MTAKKRGQPTKYNPDYIEMLKDHMAEGYSYESFAGVIRVNIDTLYEWEKVHEEFSEAKKIARSLQLLANEKTLTDIIKGKIRNGNVVGHIFKMKNCHKWTDRVEQTTIDLSKEDTKTLLEEAKQLTKELEV